MRLRPAGRILTKLLGSRDAELLMRRFSFLVATLLLIGCGRMDGASPQSGSAEAVEPVPSRTPIAAPELLHLLGEPPIWDLDMTVTAELFHHFVGALRPDEGESDEELLVRYGLPSGCNGRGDAPALGFDDCFGKVLEDAGASPESVALLRDFGVIVRAVEGSGPVWVAWLFDISYYDSNGFNANYVFTPSGILTKEILWSLPAYQDAIEAAKASADYSQIDEALSPYLTGASYGQFGGEDNFLGAPVESTDGWTVPLTMGLTGCHACESEFAGRFAIDFTPEGALEGVRFIDHCYYEDEVREWAADPAILAVKATIPTCEPHSPHDGSVRALP